METATVLIMPIQQQLRKFRRPIKVLLVWLALFIWLALTNPQKLPIVLLIVPFSLLFAAIFLTSSLVMRRFLPRLGRGKRRLAAGCLAGLPTFILILSSVNQLTWRDVALIAFLSIFLLFYASRARFSS
jgi:hypothetical protein